MEQGVEYLGEWWLPDRPERRFCGTLTFVPTHGLKLRLLGGFTDDSKAPSNDRYPIVHGQASNIGDVTLVGCWKSSYFPLGTRFVPAPTIVECRARTAFVGAHLSTAEELHFRKIRVRFTHLLEWINQRSIHGDIGRPENGGRVTTVTYRWPVHIRARSGPFEVVFQDEGSASQSWYNAEMTQSYVAVLEADEPLRVRDWQERIISPLEDLLTFATGAPNTATGFEVSLPDANGDGWAKVVSKTRDQRPESKQLSPEDMVFAIEAGSTW